MKLLFFSDPHLGVHRHVNTTAWSRRMLKDTVNSHLLNSVLSLADADTKVICGGDLFDTFSNEETDIIQAQEPFQRIDVCLAGNHDITPDRTKRGSLDLLAEWRPQAVVRAPYGEKLFHVEQYPSTDVYLVPHHSSKQLFEEALQDAYNHRSASGASTHAIILLHCNFNKPAIALQGDAQNLSDEDAKILLEAFDFVLLGHEHHPVDYYDGRLLLIGNTFPTSFGDISDKRVLAYDTDTGEMESHEVWSKQRGYLEIPAEALPSGLDIPIPKTVQFVEVKGVVEAGQVAAVSRGVSDRIWKPYVNQLLAVRNNTGVLRDEKAVAVDLTEDAVVTLPERIDKSLQGTKMYPLWRDIYIRRKENASA